MSRKNGFRIEILAKTLSPRVDLMMSIKGRCPPRADILKRKATLISATKYPREVCDGFLYEEKVVKFTRQALRDEHSSHKEESPVTFRVLSACMFPIKPTDKIQL